MLLLELGEAVGEGVRLRLRLRKELLQLLLVGVRVWGVWGVLRELRLVLSLPLPLSLSLS